MARPAHPDINALTARAAREAGIDPGLYNRLITKGERSWKGWQASPMGAFGPAQLMPDTAAGLAAKYHLDPQDYYGNLLAGAHYLREQLSTFHGDRRKAVAAYNAGPGNVQKYGGTPPFAETQRYVKNIFSGWNGKADQTVPSGALARTPPRATAATAPRAAPGFTPPPSRQATASDPFAALRMISGGISPLAALGGGGGGPGGFDTSATATLARIVNTPAPAPRFRPPARAALPGTTAPGATVPATTGRQPASAAGPAVKLGNFVRPLSTAMPGGSEFSVSDAEGAPSARGGRYHAGKDWFAPGGSPVMAPVGGRVVEVKESRGNSGQIFGGVVKIQDKNGRVFVFRHVDPRGVRVGQRVKPGARIASVSPWKDGSPHSHVEIWKTLEGGYNYENMLDPAAVFGE